LSNLSFALPNKIYDLDLQVKAKPCQDKVEGIREIELFKQAAKDGRVAILEALYLHLFEPITYF